MSEFQMYDEIIDFNWDEEEQSVLRDYADELMYDLDCIAAEEFFSGEEM